MRRWMKRGLAWAVVAGLGAYLVAQPRGNDPVVYAMLTGDAAAGEQVFWAAGCASCHAAPEAVGAAELVLKGGQRFPSDFGTFIAPNISTDLENGIGGWSLLQVANAITRGVSPDGRHYYPALPYASYRKMDPQDVANLYEFLRTLPADPTPSAAHELGFPFNIRQSLGFWKVLFARDGWALQGNLTPTADRGRYIAEAMAHCGECHTPRNALGGMDKARWMGGAPNPTGEGRIPNITPGALDWSESEIVEYLTTGFTPEFDSASGHMVHVVENMARLPVSDREAVAAYLKAVPAVEDEATAAPPTGG